MMTEKVLKNNLEAQSTLTCDPYVLQDWTNS